MSKQRKLHVVDLPSTWDCCYLIPVSDLHIGDKHFNEDKFRRYLDWILSVDNTRVILAGDILNTAIAGSVSDTYEETLTPQQQLKYATLLLSPLKGKIIGACSGNHEHRLSKVAGIDITETLVNSIDNDIPYDKEGLFLKIRLGEKHNRKQAVYSVYCTHGFGGGKKPGGKANNLQSLSGIVLADVYIMAHVHQMMTFQDIVFVPDMYNNNIMEMKRTYASSSSFVSWGGYSQRLGFSPSKLGTPRIRLDGKKKDVHVSI
jgi:predicted phosphodiesterase